MAIVDDDSTFFWFMAVLEATTWRQKDDDDDDDDDAAKSKVTYLPAYLPYLGVNTYLIPLDDTQPFIDSLLSTVHLQNHRLLHTYMHTYIHSTKILNLSMYLRAQDLFSTYLRTFLPTYLVACSDGKAKEVFFGKHHPPSADLRKGEAMMHYRHVILGR